MSDNNRRARELQRAKTAERITRVQASQAMTDLSKSMESAAKWLAETVRAQQLELENGNAVDMDMLIAALPSTSRLAADCARACETARVHAEAYAALAALESGK